MFTSYISAQYAQHVPFIYKKKYVFIILYSAQYAQHICSNYKKNNIMETLFYLYFFPIKRFGQNELKQQRENFHVGLNSHYTC